MKDHRFVLNFAGRDANVVVLVPEPSQPVITQLIFRHGELQPGDDVALKKWHDSILSDLEQMDGKKHSFAPDTEEAAL